MYPDSREVAATLSPKCARPPPQQARALSSRVLLCSIGLGLGGGGLLGNLLLARDAGLDADAAKDEPDAEPLHVGEAVAEGDDGEDHGEHLAGDGDGDEQDGGEGGERVDCCACVRRAHR